jgi:site-specific DNA recombinase
MINAVAYIRTSTDKQHNSVEAQESLIRAQATVKEANISEIIFDEDEYSGDLNRPGVQRVMELVRGRKIDAVIITRLDRLTRSTRDAVDLIELFAKHHVALISINESLDTDSPMGRFFVRMIASLSELEREMIGSRTKAGLKNIKDQGCAAGNAPYGWSATPRTQAEKDARAHSKLVVNEAEQAVMRRVVHFRNQRYKWVVVAEAINKEGHRNRRGKPFTFQDVAKIYTIAKTQEAA